jgi:nucleoside-diphosphate-sugar epimerase
MENDMAIDNELFSLIRRDCAEVAESNSVATTGLLKELKGDCLLVTGGTGFMGSWIAEMVAYLNDTQGFGIKLILLSEHARNFATRAPHLASRSDVTVVEQDVRNIQELPNDVNWIIHAAGSPDNRSHVSDPLRTFHVLVSGTNAVLAAATRLPNLKRFLNVSSGLVYGPQPLDLLAISETTSCISNGSAVTGLYAEAKRAAEMLCAAYRTQYRLSITTVRPFAFAGPYQLLDRPWAINNFFRDAILGVPIRILGDGETVRSYMYPSDMAWWMLHLLVRGVNGLSYNVGSSQPVTLNQLASMIVADSTQPPPILTNVAGDAHLRRSRFVPDTTLAQSTLGLTLQVDLPSTIKRTVSWNQRIK